MDRLCRIGLVLEGGGAKGAFSLGFAKRCRELEIEFCAVSGTSVGGLNAWLAATGQLDAGEKLWRELNFTKIYAPKLLPWKPVALALFIIHSFQYWLQGLPPAPDRNSKVNYVLIALFRSVTFLPLILIYMGLFDAHGFQRIAGVGIFAVYAALPLIELVRKVPSCDYSGRDQTLDGIPGQILGVLFLTNLIAIGIALFRAVTGEFGAAEWHVFVYATGLITASILGSVANLVDTPLVAIIDQFTNQNPRVACFVTTAERASRYSMLEPNVQAFSGAPDEGLKYAIYPSTHFLPTYHDLQGLNVQKRRLLLRATAALPFGLVNEVSYNGVAFVDGGMADNLPALPLLGQNLELIVAVRLRKEEGNQEEWLEREMKRIASLRELPEQIPHLGPFNTRGDAIQALHNAINMPTRKLCDIPKLKIVCPDEDIGGLLDFSGTARKIKLGEDAADAFAAEFGLGTIPHCEVSQ